MAAANSGSIKDSSILPAGKKHLDGMVKCHILAFPGEFITLIGPRFIKGFYGFYIANKDAIVFTSVDACGRVIGFICGGAPNLRQKFSRRYAMFYALDIVSSAIRSDYARRRLFYYISEAAKKPFRRILSRISSKGRTAKNSPGRWSSLLSVCTVPDFRGRGIGTALMQRFEAESQARGYRSIRLSALADNWQAISFYKKCGWQVVSESNVAVYFQKNLE